MGMHLANAFAPLSCTVDDDIPCLTGVCGAFAVRADEAIPAEASKAGRRWAPKSIPSARRPRTISAKEMFPSLQKDAQKELNEVVSFMIIEEEADEVNAVRKSTTVRVFLNSRL